MTTFYLTSVLHHWYPVLLLEHTRYDFYLVENDGSLDGRLVSDALESLAPLFKFEGFVDNALGLDLTAV